MTGSRRTLVAASVVCIAGAVLTQWARGDWDLLYPGGRWLLHLTGLHTYAAEPGLQIGPPGLLLIGLLALAGPAIAADLIHVLLLGCGMGIAWLATRASAPGGTSDRVAVRRTTLWLVAALPWLAHLFAWSYSGPALFVPLLAAVGGFALVRSRRPATAGDTVPVPRVLWCGLLAVGPWAALAAAETHLEDGLALVAIAVALQQAQRGRRWPVAAAVGVAIAFKPWAVAALPLLVDPDRKPATAGRVLLAGIIPAICWLPFVVADPRTLHAASHGFSINPASTPYLLGLHAMTAPPWLRSLQLLAIVSLACAGLRRSRADAVAAGMVGRLLFDPGVWLYYAAGAAAMIALADVVQRRPAWRTAVAAVVLFVWPAATPHQPTLQAAVRTLVLLVLLASQLSGEAAWSRLRVRVQAVVARRPVLAWAAPLRTR